MERELDMGFAVAEVVDGLERLLKRLGGNEVRPVREQETTRFDAPGGVTVEVLPMPEERLGNAVWFPRTLVVLRGDEDRISTLYREIVVAFWRVGG